MYVVFGWKFVQKLRMTKNVSQKFSAEMEIDKIDSWLTRFD
jgi:hypothetical protein